MIRQSGLLCALVASIALHCAAILVIISIALPELYLHGAGAVKSVLSARLINHGALQVNQSITAGGSQRSVPDLEKVEPKGVVEPLNSVQPDTGSTDGFVGRGWGPKRWRHALAEQANTQNENAQRAERRLTAYRQFMSIATAFEDLPEPKWEINCTVENDKFSCNQLDRMFESLVLPKLVRLYSIDPTFPAIEVVFYPQRGWALRLRTYGSQQEN